MSKFVVDCLHVMHSTACIPLSKIHEGCSYNASCVSTRAAMSQTIKLQPWHGTSKVKRTNENFGAGLMLGGFREGDESTIVRVFCC